VTEDLHQNLIQASQGNGEGALKVSALSLENSRWGNENSEGQLMPVPGCKIMAD